MPVQLLPTWHTATALPMDGLKPLQSVWIIRQMYSRYDFGSRYDTALEYKQIKRLTDKSIIHRMHFNYPQESSGESMELPVETQLLIIAALVVIWILVNALRSRNK